MDAKDYFEAVNDSSNRTRNAIYILLLTSLMTFFGFWNVRPTNWLTSRIEIRTDIIKYLGWDAKVRNQLKSLDDKRAFDRSKEAAEIYGIDVKAQLTTNEVVEIKDELKAQVIELEKIKISDSFIAVPVFNVVIDINDLGVLSGIAFIIILFMLKANLYRSFENIKFIFNESEEKGDLLDIFNHLIMSQVLSNPPRKSNLQNFFDGLIYNIYILLPLSIESYSFIINYQQTKFGLILNPSATIFILASTIIELIIILALTISCIRYYYIYNLVWHHTAKKLKLI